MNYNLCLKYYSWWCTETHTKTAQKSPIHSCQIYSYILIHIEITLCWYYLFIDNKVDIKYNFKIYINFLLCFYVVASLFFYWVLWVETHKSFWVCVLFFHVCLSSPLIIQDLFLMWCYFSFNCKIYDIYSTICYEFASPHQRHRHRYWHADVTKLI